MASRQPRTGQFDNQPMDKFEDQSTDQPDDQRTDQLEDQPTDHVDNQRNDMSATSDRSGNSRTTMIATVGQNNAEINWEYAVIERLDEHDLEYPPDSVSPGERNRQPGVRGQPATESRRRGYHFLPGGS